MNLYLALKVIHILSATILLGTGLGTAFHLWFAHLSGDVRVIARVSRQVVWADFWLTTPAVIIQPVTGFAMIFLAKYDLWASWLKSTYILYLVTGLCWLPVLWLQWRVSSLTRKAQDSANSLPPAYYVWMRIWFLLGWPAFLAVISIIVLMVFKPDF